MIPTNATSCCVPIWEVGRKLVWKYTIRISFLPKIRKEEEEKKEESCPASFFLTFSIFLIHVYTAYLRMDFLFSFYNGNLVFCKVNFLITAGRTPNKKFCYSKSEPSGYYLPIASYDPSVRNHGILAKIHGKYDKFLGSLAKILPWSCHDLGKDAMAMQDRAKANHDLGKDTMINHVLAKGFTVTNPLFW